MEKYIAPLNAATVFLILIAAIIFVFKQDKRKVFFKKKIVAKDVLLGGVLGIAVAIAVTYFIVTSSQ